MKNKFAYASGKGVCCLCCFLQLSQAGDKWLSFLNTTVKPGCWKLIYNSPTIATAVILNFGFTLSHEKGRMFVYCKSKEVSEVLEEVLMCNNLERNGAIFCPVI